MADETLEIGVELDGSGATRDLRNVADAVGSLSDAMRELTSSIRPLATQLDKVEKGVSGVSQRSKSSVSNIQASTQAMREQAAAARTLSQNLIDIGRKQPANAGGRTFVTDQRGTTQPVGGYDASKYNQELAALNALGQAKIREAAATRARVQANIAESKAARDAGAAYRSYAQDMLEAQRQAQTQYQRRHAVPQRASDNVYNAAIHDGRQIGSSFGVIEKGADDAAASVDKLQNGLFTARFALNDISRGTAIAGTALLGMSTAAITAAASYEDAMAAIQRTTGANRDQMVNMRKDFVELAQSVPAGFQNIADIGELAGQLNIPTDRIAAFTETVAMFTSSTDVAVQQSAEAFGRLDALLPDVQGNYEALGSSILHVGVNSVATESAIISTTTQIAAAGAQARFTADEVIGLAASYASLGIAPEAARGSTIRIMSEIRSATLEGGAALDEFARLAGTSAQAFAKEWLHGDADKAFMDFLYGLQREGANAETTLRALGITGVRDINALLRLSQNMDIVTENFSYANAGFSEATQLAEAFGITSETLSARVALLGQSIQAFFAELGQTGTGPIKDFVNALIEAIKFATELSRNPVVQWVAVFGGLFTVIAGGMLLITSAIARFGALTVATATMRYQMKLMAVEMAAAGVAVDSLGMKALNTAGKLTTMRGLLTASAWTAGITLAIVGITAAVTAFGEANKTAAEKAKDAWGDMSGLTAALRQDTEALEASGEEAYGHIAGTITVTKERTDSWVTSLEEATGAQTTLASEVDRVTESIEPQTWAIHKNTAAWLANKLANTEAIKEIFEAEQKLRSDFGVESNLDMGGVISAASRNDVEEANRIIDTWLEDTKQKMRDAGIADQDLRFTMLESHAIKAREAVDLVTGALSEAANAGIVSDAVFEALGVATGELGDEAGAAADSIADAANELKKMVEQAFSLENVMSENVRAVMDLVGGIVEGGTAFDWLSEAGMNNVSNLQTAVATAITAGKSMGMSAAESVAVLFMQLEQMGVNTANLLASLGGVLGVSGIAQVEAYMTGTSQLGEAGLHLQQVYSGIAREAPKAARGIGGAGGAARQAAKDTKDLSQTLSEYASDLSKVMSRAFELRFGNTAAIDKVTSQWNAMQEAINDARQAIADLQREIDGLNVDNATLEYQLGVAVNYGDDLRAAEIRQKMAENSDELAKKEQEVAKNQGILTKTTQGNTAAAIGNRDALRSLISEYEGVLKQMAANGASQAELQARAASLKQEFVTQAVQMGYNREEVIQYAAAFDDFITVIQRVPRNIRIEADVNPAVTAFREFQSAADRASNSLSGLRNNAGRGIPNISMPFADSRPFRQMALMAEISAAAAMLEQLRRSGDIHGARYQAQGLARMRHNLAIGNYKKGGYTGDVGVNQEAGIVHGKEFVINAPNTSRLGLPFLNALNAGKTPVVAAPTQGVQVVELSAFDRQLLARAGDVQLSIDGRAIASATNAANFVSTHRGVN